MRTRFTMLAVAAAMTGALIGSAGADLMPVKAISAGAETDTATGSIQNVGQVVIGDASNLTVRGQFGIIRVLASSVSPLADCGDFDNDGDVDTTDFGIFGQCFGGAFNPPAVTCPAGVDADFDDDGDVDVTDFALLAQCFTG